LALLGTVVPASGTTPVQKRIDALLQRRIRADALPLNPPNPFQMNSGIVRLSQPEEPPPVEEVPVAPKPVLPDNLEILTDIASRLKVAGVIVQKDRLHVVINGQPRQEGDSIKADWKNGSINVKIVRLLPGQITLKYSDAEFMLKF
jgi:hypothetical protein